MSETVLRNEGPAATGPARSFAVAEPAERRYVRTPVTALRLAATLVLLAFVSVALRAADVVAFADTFGDLLASAPHGAVSALVSVAQLGFLVPAMLALLAQVGLRHWARVGRLLATTVVCVAGLLLLARLAGSGNLPLVPHRHETSPGLSGRSGYGIGAVFPTGLDLGVIASWTFVDRSHWSDRWRRIGRVVLAVGVVARLGVGLADPVTIVAELGVAAAAALVVQLLLGSTNVRPRAAVVGAILERFGYRVAAVERFGGFRGFVGYQVALADGARLFVKIVGRDAWTALLPVRVYRAVRFRDVGQDRPFQTLRSVVEHEALCSLKAHADGVPTARLAVVTDFPPNAMLMAFETRPFRPLRDLGPAERSPALLASVWSIVAVLQRSHTVHRRLNADAILVDDLGQPIVVEFSSASLGVVGSVLSTDVAEVLAATAATLGPERAVAAAVSGVGPAAVAAALPRLQPLALTAPTRAAIKGAGGLDDLRAEIERVTGAEPVPIAELERVKVGTLVTIATAAVALWTLIPQVIGVGSLWTQVRHADLWWAGVALLLSAFTYLAAAVAFDGSVPEPVPLGPNVGVQLATSIVSVVAPGGGLGLGARFLQKRGIDTGTAVGAVAVNAVAGVVVHLTLLGLFVALAGTSGLHSFALPSTITVGVIVGGVAAVIVAGVLVPWSRALVVGRLVPAVRRSMTSIGQVAHQPTKVLELFGGSLGVTLGYILMLEVSVAAFGTGPAFTSIALVYLVGAAVASAAPTPGGLGAVEATLIAGLTSAGMPSTTAIGAVILYRLASFWVPLLPGYIALVRLQRAGDV